MFGLIAAAFLGAATGEPKMASWQWYKQYYSHLRMPPHGSVHKGVVYGFFDDDWANRNNDPKFTSGRGPSFDGIPVGKIARMNWEKTPLQGQPNAYMLRHHVAYGAHWVSRNPDYVNRLDFDRAQSKRDFKLRGFHRAF